MITKIISGGQTGADQGGLQAAKLCGILTGGYCPKGGLTEKGNNSNLMSVYGLTETKSDKYPPRTFDNAKNSDGTIRIAKDFQSRGEILTLKAINQYGKPHIDVDINNPIAPQVVINWIVKNNIQILNVAGNKESSCVGIQEYTTNFLVEIINHLKNTKWT